jgi:methyl-accepting chemotaxis protein
MRHIKKIGERKMKNRSLRFKMVVGGVMAVLIPLLIVGGFAVNRAMNALEDVSKSQSQEVAKSLANMATLAVHEEMKIVTQLATRDVVINAAAEYAESRTMGGENAAKATAEMTAMVQKSGSDYETTLVVGMDGKVIADGVSGKNQGIDISDRDYFKEAKTGKVSVGSVVKSRATGNIVMTFGAPIYSSANQVIGVVGSVININFLSDKVSAIKLGKTGYGYIVDQTGLVIAHPNKDLILVVNTMEQEGMRAFSTRMLAGETGVDNYTFKGVYKVAGFAPVSLAKWSVCVTQDYSEFMAPAYSLLWIIILIGILFLVVAVVGITFFARSIALPIGHVADDLNDASQQVASASSQVASASQSLAEGASEQASALEETSSSLEEMSSMTKHNADNAAQAKALMAQARQIVDKVDGQMKNMVTAIQEVTRSSEQTGNIIKTIDEIAFQTNLLALNAAVEAARAGEAGAGFAVVADEVRNLALRAAEAAKNTSGLIENTIVTVKNSRDLTEQTQNAFNENREITNKVGQLIDEIAAASNEQAQGIGQIGKAVAEMDKVVQQTAANAEESASAAEEMNAQAVQMENYVDNLVSIINGGHGKEMPAQSQRTSEGSGKLPAQKTGRPGAKKLLTAGTDATKKNRPVRPQDVIPLGKDDFTDF